MAQFDAGFVAGLATGLVTSLILGLAWSLLVAWAHRHQEGLRARREGGA